ncbi:glycosyltransferase involved in cell wall biosynthesis [Methanohalophilus euhalobius]|uniref:Glycosyltransferase involved in cell wall biosynthesis n=1 Tax=Methanohalophilus euhalobius TaxID=51203 RepID=A0A285F4Y2_9EURY|nr:MULTISPECIES: glycosyltransferase [Methanohalophilus]RSD35073.1 MAG: glycosyltransferase [Methanohalophilus sp.]ODV49998.1 MAG: glycosyltransferase [Methanohalophilus sp. 2-GBenrich]RXG34818.1 glycosyltransferase [Methanohalophilus sp. WG1-DM]TCL12308.1 glycosyltransferase involved in cell wall biosynthesis [Methanohalophilus euhalobius]SNY06359.1 Glycosyltransferase involved in cell wall bisynthesis [Methanohalophilus euhalobius]
MQINQVLPALSCHDAVSNDAIEIMKFLRKQGFDSNIYAKHTHPKVSKYTKSIDKYHGNDQNILIYHFSLYSEDVTDFVKKLPDKKILLYHNITPPKFFDGLCETLSYSCAKGLDELKDLFRHFQVGVGVSEYNRLCLENYGFKNTDVLPILININKFESHNEKNLKKRSYIDSTINIIFVGRISPNKKHEDIIKTFYYYQRYINSNSVLYLVGNEQISSYSEYLRNLIDTLGLRDHIIFTGMVTDEDLVEYYKKAHLFLCMSEHEGFCVPLLEAMYFEIPIIAYNSTGVPYTLDNSGILVNKKQYNKIAELINLLIEEKVIRGRIIQKQNERLMAFDKEKTGKKLIKIIEGLNNKN